MPKYKGAYKELLNEEETPQVEEVAAAPEQEQEEETLKNATVTLDGTCKIL